MGLFRIGFVTIYLSDPLTRALTMSAAIHVFTSQIKHVFGISMGRFSGPFKLIYVSMSDRLYFVLYHFNLLNRFNVLQYPFSKA
jgi:MFS superfamily sulfate permease-like transporter